jgi:hypothetical protein
MAFFVGVCFQRNAVLANVLAEFAKALDLIFPGCRLTLLMFFNSSLVVLGGQRG